MDLRDIKAILGSLPDTPKMPVLFVGHGSPMNLVEDNVWSRAWKAMGASLPRPHVILCISAHWFTRGTFVHVAEKPKTIHDFYGFSTELYRLEYACPGAPEVAEAAARLITEAKVGRDTEWGIDHGAMLPLHHLFPKADVPTFQLSIDGTKPAQFQYDLAKELAPLRRKGVLILASGNIVHNLGIMEPDPSVPPPDWATAFDEKSVDLILNGDHRALIDYRKLGEAALFAVPTPDHYFPMLSALALQEKGEEPRFFTDGIVFGSVSMRSFVIGARM
jgi:4,5-DOPA dioxygenase extradiol